MMEERVDAMVSPIHRYTPDEDDDMYLEDHEKQGKMQKI